MPNEPRVRTPKACLACAQAKVKCDSNSNGKEELGNGCKRCLRLNIPCHMQSPGGHKRKAEGASSDVTRLEQKLDDMAAIFTAASQRLLSTTIEQQQAGHSRQASSSSASLQILEQTILKDNEAFESLSSFRHDITPSFPFVAVSKDVSISELREKRPFLLSTIAMVTCHADATRQLEMVRSIRQYISTAVLLREEFSFDLLQGLLVCLSWFHLQVPLGVQIGNLLHLAMSILTDLGLHRKCRSNTKMAPIMNQPRKLPRNNTPRSLDERRAYLGCFFLNSVASMCLIDMDPMRYTAYTEECCHAIEAAGEYPTDQHLVRLVRMHRMTEKINRSFAFDEFDEAGPVASTPIGMTVKFLEKELLDIKQSIPSVTFNDTLLLMHYYIIELHLYEIALKDDFPAEKYGNYPLSRLNILYSCLTSVRALFETFASIQLPDYFRIPYSIYGSCIYAIGVLSHLLLIRYENWDREYARSVLDIPTAINMAIGRIKADVEMYGIPNLPYRVPDAFVRLLPRIEIFKELHELKRTAMESDSETGQDLNWGTIPFPFDLLQDLDLFSTGDYTWQQHLLP